MKLFLTIIAVSFYLNLFAQTSITNDLARVNKVNGVEVYVMSEPLRDYETVSDVGTGLKAESLLTGGIINKSISERISQFVHKAKKENEDIDAVIYSNGKRVIGIKFKTEGTMENIGIARVTKIKGFNTFVMCEPLNDYKVLETKGGGVKWKSAITGGVVNNSIEDDVRKIVDKLDNIKEADAFIFDGSKEGSAIGFKK
ncbi:MAG: hypothetical protein Q7U21_08755 [Lutibacter sp.]|nr:hypothetical protein [Lutibacter sp.]